jgi:hypothetical protein
MSKLDELEEFFKGVDLSKNPIYLDDCTKIVDISKFLESHFHVLRSNSGNKKMLPFYDRLVKMKNLIENEKTIKK